MSGFEEKLTGFKNLVKRMKTYEEALNVMYWDMRTGAPKKGIEGRSEVVGLLSTELFQMSTSDEMGEYLQFFAEKENEAKLGTIERKMAEEQRKEYERGKKIPPGKYREYVVLTSKSESVWEEAKQKSDFEMFRPYLEKVVAFNREFVELWGYEGHKYNTLLDHYEPGMTVQKLDQVFGALRSRIVPLVQAVQEAKDQPETGFLHQTFAKEKQKAFNLFILEQMGYDFAAGRLDETEHPFAIGINPGDVRITTRYIENDITFALFGTIHEGGHALYEQNISKELEGTNLAGGTSMGIHESQSRFWENMVGRSPEFWSRYFGDLQKTYPNQLEGVTAEGFYRAINEAKPDLIRIEADELTYNLHIMIRYEIEKALIEGSIQAADLPGIWNEKYKEYLGVTPDSDRTGVLQDVHWAGGGFGYFPSYALGNMYAAQFRNKLMQELPNFEQLIAEGNLGPIKEWLTDKVYRHGKLLTPNEIITQATGEELNPDYLVAYLEEKYKGIYRL